MHRAKILSGLLLALLAIVLAVLASLHSASIVLQRTTPDAALQLRSGNGQAQGRLAMAQFSAASAQGQSPEVIAKGFEALALEAVKNEPLNARAHSILAWAASDREKRKRILDPALQLNRRSSALLALALQENTADKDVDGTIQTLNLLLRVHPETSSELFPALNAALVEDSAIASFKRVLAGAPSWQDRFLRQAMSKPEAIANVALLRRDLEIEQEGLDEMLVKRLVANGQFSEAQVHYAFLQRQIRTKGPDAFRTSYPPFDWQLADKREFRAQLSRGGDSIEVFVRSGFGGTLMERIFERQSNTFEMSLSHNVEPATQLENVRIKVRCLGEERALVDESFRSGKLAYSVPLPAESCDFVKVTIDARSFTGRPSLRGEITEIVVN